MKYPMLSNSIDFEKIDENRYKAVDIMTDEAFVLNSAMYYFVTSLDGKTRPSSIYPNLSRKKRNEIMDMLEENGFLRHSRVLLSETGTLLYTLLIPDRANPAKTFATVADTLLRVLWLPFLIFGLISIPELMMLPVYRPSILYSFPGIILGALLHELGHACACIRSGGKLYEMGVMINNFLPGAYCMIDHASLKRRRDRIHLNAAGVEWNFLLSGILVLTAIMTQRPDIFLNMAIANICTGALNLCFVQGMDGCSILDELLGCNDIISLAKQELKKPGFLRRLLFSGMGSHIKSVLCIVLLLCQCLPFVIIISNLAVIILWIM